MSTPKSIQIVTEFVAKILVATIVFLMIGAAAIALNLFNLFAETRNLVPPYVAYVLIALEYLIFGLDATCFGIFLVMEAFRFLKDISRISRV